MFEADELLALYGFHPHGAGILEIRPGVKHFDLAPLLHNDLQPAALDLRPDLAVLLEAGEAAGALRGLVSGSGPTCVFLCADESAALEVSRSLRASYDVVLVASGPVTGALGR